MQKFLLLGTNKQLILNCLPKINMKNYIIISVPAISKAELIQSIKVEKPRGIIISLKFETEEDLKVYDTIKAYDEYSEIPILVVGHDEVIEDFNRIVWKNVTFELKRPFKNDDLVRALDNLVSNTLPVIYKSDDTKMLSDKSLGKGYTEKVVVPKTRTVLVIDDDPKMLRSIKVQLDDMYKVILVNSGRKALEYLSKGHADIILLDYIMPDENGPEVLKEIRHNPNTKKIPVIFLTGVSDRNLATIGIELGPQAYLLKPVSRATLIQTINKYI